MFFIRTEPPGRRHRRSPWLLASLTSCYTSCIVSELTFKHDGVKGAESMVANMLKGIGTSIFPKALAWYSYLTPSDADLFSSEDANTRNCVQIVSLCPPLLLITDIL